MKRTAPDRTTGQPKPVKRVEVRDGHLKARITLVILAIVVALAAFSVGVAALTSVSDGWQEIEVTSSGKMNCSQDFYFNYYLGASGMSATAELKAITALYTQATEHAYQVFNVQGVADDFNNLYYLNRKPNTPVQVDEVLYRAFQQVNELDSRYMFMAPALAEYTSLFYCTEDWETEGFDPYQNDELRDYLAQVAAFARDPQAISITLLGDNTLQLNVSEEYAAFAKKNGVVNLVDFDWMKNAFIIDYLAQVMENAGYTRGAISSYDGFVRCLGEEQLTYSFNLYDRLESGSICTAGRLNYAGGTSLVHLHSFVLNPEKETYAYQFADGTVRTAHVDMADGLCKQSLPVLIGTSRGASCAEILLRILPYYAADQLDEAGLLGLTEQDVYPVYIRDKEIVSTSPDVTVDSLYDGYTMAKENMT